MCRVVHRRLQGDREVDREVQRDGADDASPDGLRDPLANAEVERDRRAERTKAPSGRAGRGGRGPGVEPPRGARRSAGDRGGAKKAESQIRSVGDLQLRGEDPERVRVHQQVDPADVQQRVRADAPEVSIANRWPVERAEPEERHPVLDRGITAQQRLRGERHSEQDQERPGGRAGRTDGALGAGFLRRLLADAAQRIDHNALSTAARSFCSTPVSGPTAQATRFSRRNTAEATRRTSAAVTRSMRESHWSKGSAGGGKSSPPPNHPIISAGGTRGETRPKRGLFFSPP